MLALPDNAIISDTPKVTFNSGLPCIQATWVLKFSSSWFWQSSCYHFNGAPFISTHTTWGLCIFNLCDICFGTWAPFCLEGYIYIDTCIYIYTHYIYAHIFVIKLELPWTNSEIRKSQYKSYFGRVMPPVSSVINSQIQTQNSCSSSDPGPNSSWAVRSTKMCQCCAGHLRFHWLFEIDLTLYFDVWNLLLNLISCGAIAFNSIYNTRDSIQKLEQLHVCRSPNISCKHLLLVTCHWRTFPSWHGTNSSFVHSHHLHCICYMSWTHFLPCIRFITLVTLFHYFIHWLLITIIIRTQNDEHHNRNDNNTSKKNNNNNITMMIIIIIIIIHHPSSTMSRESVP